MRYYLINLLLSILPISRCYGIKRLILILGGASIGKNVRVMNIKIQGVHLHIGDNSFIGDGTIIIGGESNVKIGRNCDISSRVSIVTGTHKSGSIEKAAGEGYSESIVIEDGVWIGFGVTVLHGVTIGKGSIIAAGSVVTKNIPSGVLAAGVPARVKKNLYKDK